MSEIWVATWVMLLSENHLATGAVFNRVAYATTWGQDDMIGFVVLWSMLPTKATRSPASGLPPVAVLESVRYVLVPC